MNFWTLFTAHYRHCRNYSCPMTNHMQADDKHSVKLFIQRSAKQLNSSEYIQQKVSNTSSQKNNT